MTTSSRCKLYTCIQVLLLSKSHPFQICNWDLKELAVCHVWEQNKTGKNSVGKTPAEPFSFKNPLKWKQAHKLHVHEVLQAFTYCAKMWSFLALKYYYICMGSFAMLQWCYVTETTTNYIAQGYGRCWWHWHRMTRWIGAVAYICGSSATHLSWVWYDSWQHTRLRCGIACGARQYSRHSPIRLNIMPYGFQL